MNTPAVSIGVEFQNCTGLNRGRNNDVRCGIAVAVPREVVERKQIRVGKDLEKAGFQCGGNGICVMNIVGSAFGAVYVENSSFIVKVEMLAQKQVVRLIGAQKELIILCVLGQIFDFDALQYFDFRGILRSQTRNFGKIRFQLVVRHPRAEIMIRKGRVIGKTEYVHSGLQRRTYIIFLCALSMEAPLGMRMVICFHNMSSSCEKQNSL